MHAGATPAGRSALALWLLALLVLALAFWEVLRQLGSGVLDPAFLFHSDALYLPALYRDVFEEGGRWWGWRLTPAPYFFPDMALYFTWNAMPGDFRVAMVGFAATQLLLLLLLLLGARTLACTLRPGEARLGPALAALLTAGLLGLYALGRFWPLQYALQSAHHFGLVPVSLFALAAAVHTSRAPASRARWALAGLCILTAASDPLFLVAFSLPAVLALALLSRWAGTRGPLWAALWLGLGSLIGNFAPRLVSLRYRPQGYLRLRADLAADSLRVLAEETRRLALTDAPWGMLLWCGSLLGAALLVVAAVRARHSDEGLSLRRLRGALGLFLLSCVATSALAAVLTGSFGDATTFRYFTAALFLPLFLGPVVVDGLVASPRLQRALARAALGGALAGLGLLLTHAPWSAPARPLWRYVSPLVACLDAHQARHSLTWGVSDYWMAKHITLLSRAGLRAHQVEPAGLLYHWINNVDWYLGTPARRPAYNFLVTAGLDLPELRRRFGLEPPRATFTCEGVEVQVWTGEGGRFNESVVRRFAADRKVPPPPWAD